MPFYDLAVSLPPNGQDASSHWTSIQEPTHILQQPVGGLSPIGYLPKHRDHPLEGQGPMSIFH